MKLHMSVNLLTVALSLHLVFRIISTEAAGQCGSQSSIYGRALKFHTFDKFKVDRPDICTQRCQNERKCQSINYVMEESICELNNRSKETRPGDYVSDPKRFYMTVHFNKVPLGSSVENPAESCEEMKAIKGREPFSGDYWLDPENNGDATQIFCLETKGTPFHWTLNGNDNQLNLHGAAKFVEESGRIVLYLDGTQGTYAETSAVPFQQTDLTIAVWIKLLSPLSSSQEIYADWSSPFQFRLGVHSAAGSLCFQGRRDTHVTSDMITGCTGASVNTDVWSHVAMTWGRADRKYRLYINGEVKLDKVIPDNPVLDLKSSGHTVYDIGLKRDSGTTIHAYFSDLVIFTQELSGTELKNGLFFNHPLRSFI